MMLIELEKFVYLLDAEHIKIFESFLCLSTWITISIKVID